LSEETVEESFRAARARLEGVYASVVSETESKVERAKSEALRKLTP